ncbi:hypothetical protein HDU92_008722 [Lobulomyces angularis]|nr:hypothetical protein HDU92_008722 [Lobulomyces angularis]
MFSFTRRIKNVSLINQNLRYKSTSSNATKNSIGRSALKIVSGSSLILGAAVIYNKETSDSTSIPSAPFTTILQRPFHFWSKLFPIFLHYKYTQWSVNGKNDADQDAAFELLHETYAQNVLDLILELRGIFIKFGQVGAMRADIFPETYRNKFKLLLDSVPPLSEEESIKIVEDSLNGKKIEDVFSVFEPKAIGAASIGQVHKAKLKNGDDVVVKIKYPDSHALFSLDFETFYQFAKIALPEQLPAMNELKDQFLKEFDFEREAWALETVRKNIMPHFSNVIVPKTYNELCSKNIIVMEFIPGVRLLGEKSINIVILLTVKILDGILKSYEFEAKRMGFTFDELKKRKESNLNFSNGEKMKIFLRLSAFTLLDKFKLLFFYTLNYSFGFILPKKFLIQKPFTGIDKKKIFDLLVEVHGHEILIDRIFQGDPHLGNIILTPEGKLGLIDYGQVKCISQKDARNYAQMIKYLKHNKREELLELAKVTGFTTENNDPYVLYKTLQVLLDSDSREVCEGMNLQQFMEKLSKQDKTKTIPDQFVFAVRAAVLLRGIGGLLGFHEVSLASRWEHFANAVLAKKIDVENDDKVFDFHGN